MQSDFRENLHLALDTVREHKLRSFLAILGVMIGVALIILVVGLVQGFRQTIQDEIVSEGIDTAFVSRFDQGPQNGRRPKDEKLPSVSFALQLKRSPCPPFSGSYLTPPAIRALQSRALIFAALFPLISPSIPTPP